MRSLGQDPSQEKLQAIIDEVDVDGKIYVDAPVIFYLDSFIDLKFDIVISNNSFVFCGLVGADLSFLSSSFSGNGQIEFEEFILMMSKQCTQHASDVDILEAFKVHCNVANLHLYLVQC